MSATAIPHRLSPFSADLHRQGTERHFHADCGCDALFSCNLRHKQIPFRIRQQYQSAEDPEHCILCSYTQMPRTPCRPYSGASLSSSS